MKHRDQQHKADSPQPQENNEEQKENEESYEYKRIEDYEERLQHLDECAFEPIDDKLSKMQNQYKEQSKSISKDVKDQAKIHKSFANELIKKAENQLDIIEKMISNN